MQVTLLTSSLALVACLVLVLVVVVGGITWLLTRGRKSSPRHFDIGVTEEADVRDDEDVWEKGIHTVTRGSDVAAVFAPRAEEATRESVERETTEFPDDLLDPENPQHAEWEQREQERLREAQARAALRPDPDAGAPGPS